MEIRALLFSVFNHHDCRAALAMAGALLSYNTFVVQFNFILFFYFVFDYAMNFFYISYYGSFNTKKNVKLIYDHHNRGTKHKAFAAFSTMVNKSLMLYFGVVQKKKTAKRIQEHKTAKFMLR